MKLINEMFSIVSKGDRVRIKLHPEHVIYDAHFPGQPITPGVCLVQMIGEILQENMAKLHELAQYLYEHETITGDEFMSILSAAFTSRFEKRIINVHPSLIPSFCGKGFYGLKVHEAALNYGVKVTGATVHYVNEVPDGGQILLQKAVPVLPGDTPEVLQKRVMEEAEWLLLPEAAELVSARILSEKKENEL